jgi:hypothetical protein
MEWLFEKPLFIVVIGVSTAVVLGGIWLQTGRRPALYALLLTLGLTGAALLVERMVETDRETIRAMLFRIASHVERNDLESALQYAHSEAGWIRSQAEAELRPYEFHDVNIKANLEIQVELQREPAEASAEFNVVVVLSDRSGIIQHRRIPRFVSVQLRKEGDQWRIVDYEHDDPSVGFQRRK